MTDPVIDASDVAPHPAGPLLVDVDLQQEPPLPRDGLKQSLGTAPLVAGPVTAVDAVRDELAFAPHIVLYELRVPEEVMIHRASLHTRYGAHGAVVPVPGIIHRDARVFEDAVFPARQIHRPPYQERAPREGTHLERGARGWHEARMGYARQLFALGVDVDDACSLGIFRIEPPRLPGGVVEKQKPA